MAFDYNADNEIDVLDLVRLKNYLVGKKVSIGEN